MTAALDVEGLDLVLDAAGRRLHVVRGVDLVLRRGEVTGLIGESGSGKTMTGLALLRLEPERSALTARTMRAGGADLLHASPAALRELRGRTIGMIFQDPVGAFNPAKRIGWHARAVLDRAVLERAVLERAVLERAVLERAGEGRGWRAAATAMLAEVEIADAARVLAAYPHQLSGGMLQRVLIALVLAAGPSVVVADEPTTNLDNIVERQILQLFRRLKQRNGAAFLFITHDMTIAASLCDRLAVMYAGELIETGAAAALFNTPKHPYTAALIATARALQGDAARLPELAGELPSPAQPRIGCAFAPRCPQAMPACTAAPIPDITLEEGRRVRCLLYA